jgi:hypothetical protein
VLQLARGRRFQIVQPARVSSVTWRRDIASVCQFRSFAEALDCLSDLVGGIVASIVAITDHTVKGYYLI